MAVVSVWIQRYVDPRNVVTHPVRWTKAFAYAKLMESGVVFPPVKAAVDPLGRIIVRNGAHRTYAARLTGQPLLIKHKAERMRMAPRGQYATQAGIS